ncbi:hypothetical protein PG994_013795 [Apiospora phragmitis]|uniref:Alpha/beta hydrolase fold-3 domain-containing protein n=1 Tax=Apiospora phragmitis TaxID=2905665 RepID=A0ABR1T4V2_9PEZI
MQLFTHPSTLWTKSPTTPSTSQGSLVLASLLSRQPFKGVYAIYLILEFLIILPWLLARYSLKSTRPFPQWNLKTCITTRAVRQIFVYHTVTRSDGLASVISDHQKAKEHYSVATPVDPELSQVLSPKFADPAAVGGLWFPGPPPGASPNTRDEKVVLHLPGSAFVLALGREMFGREVANVMSRHLGASRTLVAQYRLSSGTGGVRFPAPIQDIVTVYHQVLSLGIAPQNILLSGDSAGGTLIIAFLRYLEATSKLPPPGGALLWSPWVHVTSHAGADHEASRNFEHDILPASLLQWGVDAYLPERQPTADELPYISPLHHPFRTSVPLHINAGSAEAFFDTIKEFADEMAGMNGNQVRFQPAEFAPHDLVMLYKGYGMEREVELATKDALEFFGWQGPA